MAVEELLKHVHPDAVYHRVPLPDDQNALGPWREAIERHIPPDDDDPLWGKLIYGDGETGTPVAFPSGPEGERLRALLDRNQAALELLEAGIRRGRLQLPLRHGFDMESPDGKVAISVAELSRMLWVKAKALEADGDCLGTWSSLIQYLRIGDMICNGDGILIDYLCGSCLRKSALNRLRALAESSNLPGTALTELRSIVENSLGSADGLAQCLRANFCCTDLVTIDSIPEGAELEKLVDRLLAAFYTNTCFTFSGSPQAVEPSDDRVTWRRAQIISLLDGHPRPFDKIATIRLMGKRAAAGIHSLQRPRRPWVLGFARAWRGLLGCLRRRLFSGLKYWPDQLAPVFPVDALGPSQEACAARAELAKDLAGHWDVASWQLPTESYLALCRRKLRRVRNPVGRMIAEQVAPTDYRYVADQYRTALTEIQNALRKRLGG